MKALMKIIKNYRSRNMEMAKSEKFSRSRPLTLKTNKMNWKPR